MARRSLLRPPGFDELGLRRAMADRMLPFLVAAMAFLAALALAGWVGAATLAQHWQHGAGASLTVQVPQPGDPAIGRTGPDARSRLDRVIETLTATPGIAGAHALSRPELGALLRPWLGGGDAALLERLPAVIAVRLAEPPPTPAAFAALDTALRRSAPGTVLESQGLWIGRLLALARSLQACAGAALLVVAAVAAAVVAVATRAGLAARREAIEIVHGLGATDGFIATRFAGRATLLASAGGIAGALAALPVLLALARLAAPFTAGSAAAPASAGPSVAGIETFSGSLPVALWLLLPGLPLAAAAIGFVTAQVTVRRWLRRLP
ncbi:MAG: cell division protein FtsX [Rhodospirillales bacterium]|nr:cell division protein FtsX [Rhodospirillales bacterium]